VEDLQYGIIQTCRPGDLLQQDEVDEGLRKFDVGIEENYSFFYLTIDSQKSNQSLNEKEIPP
jgi:hypothetical protein